MRAAILQIFIRFVIPSEKWVTGTIFFIKVAQNNFRHEIMYQNLVDNKVEVNIIHWPYNILNKNSTDLISLRLQQILNVGIYSAN